jgi:putative DNA primase/helicase
MTPLDAALIYGRRGWPVFPCAPWPSKEPFTKHGFYEASCDELVIAQWWHRWPNALIAVRTGTAAGFVVLDVDVKNDAANGFDTLATLGFVILPDTRIMHTPSGGVHLHFDPGDHQIGVTQGAKGRGIGLGLDWRGNGGFAFLPSPGSGYAWDPHYGINAPLAPVPAALLPREPESQPEAKPIERTSGLSRYAKAALLDACHAIVAARAGEQEGTLVRETFSIGTLAGAQGIPTDFALRTLQRAASMIPTLDPRRPWRAKALDKKVARAFTAGLQRPRAARHD